MGRQKIEKEELETNEEFKNKFLTSKDEDFTINISSFTNIEELETFINKNKIYSDSFFFKYGNNGELIKLVNGISSDYNKLKEKITLFNFDEEEIFPIVEKISLVKKLYEDNIELNTKKEEPVEYEYITPSKEQLKKVTIKDEKKTKVIKEKLKNDDEVLKITKRPSFDEIENKKIEDIKNNINDAKEIINDEKEEISEPNVVEKEEIVEQIEIKKEEITEPNIVEKEFLSAPKNYY